MKKIYLSFSVIVAFAVFAAFSRQNVGIGIDRFLTPNVPILKNDVASSGNVPNPIPTPTLKVNRVSEGEGEGEDDGRKAVSPISAPKTAPAPSPTQPVPTVTKTTGQYKNGSFTGSVADAYYGYIQVKAVIQNGKLADVVFLQYPSDRSTSIRINTQAMPYLKSEAIAAQSANVNIVSGATDSSIAFKESLGVALASAKN